jgi:beta-lactam-binding protein with PASTA domain
VPRTSTRELRPGESGAGNVIDQTPEGGQKVDPGTQVGLVVGVAPASTTTAPPSTTTTTSRGTTTTTDPDDG